jgi:hypothetical protein
MFNPFADLTVSLSPVFMQVYVVLMILAVAIGTLVDVVHKKSAQYFVENWRNAKSKAPTQVGGAKIVSLAVQTFLLDVLASAELKDCSARRRVAHLLIMYGFVAYLIATIVMVFGYPTPATPTPAIWPLLWQIGALMVCVGGYWFWFFLRVDVLAEGYSPFRVVRADLFILSLLASATLGLLWSWLQATGVGWLFFGLYIIATTVLFGSIPWSKFAHMFFKPAAALQKRVADAEGSRSNLPASADKPETFGRARGVPQNY